MITKELITKLENDLHTTVRAMDAARFALDSAKRKHNEELTGLKLGDRVIMHGKEYAVCAFDTYEYWISGNAILKDGTISAFETTGKFLGQLKKETKNVDHS
jgi:hypothetical protein